MWFVATIEMAARSPSRSWWIRSAVILSIVVGVCLIVWGLRSPPQIGADEAVFSNVDALFTAVTSRNEALLDACERRLHALCQAEKLPADASEYLTGIIQAARAGRWQPAAQKLYWFMSVQRRDALAESAPRTHANTRTPAGKR
jgi:hypothetical protein